MQVALSTNDSIESRGTTHVTEARIKMHGHAFKILSSTMYSRPKHAIIREIGCNAADAHTIQGTPDRPFEIKLPNNNDPLFWIRDFGPGIPPEQMADLYLNYFDSTKRTDNSQIGGFGLGAKTPLCYTNSFNVTSVNNGVSRSYVIHLNNEGIPVCELLGSTPASPEWPHGVRVGFAVDPADYASFITAAEEILRWFTPSPIIFGAKLDLTRPHDANGIRMGNVFYPVSTCDIKSHLFPLVIEGAIGEFSVTPSRETLHLDEKTKTRLALRFSQETTNSVEAFLEQIISRNLSPFQLCRETPIWSWNTHALKSSLSTELADKVIQTFSMIPAHPKAEVTWTGYKLIERDLAPDTPTIPYDLYLIDVPHSTIRKRLAEHNAGEALLTASEDTFKALEGWFGYTGTRLSTLPLPPAPVRTRTPRPKSTRTFLTLSGNRVLGSTSTTYHVLPFRRSSAWGRIHERVRFDGRYFDKHTFAQTYVELRSYLYGQVTLPDTNDILLLNSSDQELAIFKTAPLLADTVKACLAKLTPPDELYDGDHLTRLLASPAAQSLIKKYKLQETVGNLIEASRRRTARVWYEQLYRKSGKLVALLSSFFEEEDEPVTDSPYPKLYQQFPRLTYLNPDVFKKTEHALDALKFALSLEAKQP